MRRVLAAFASSCFAICVLCGSSTKAQDQDRHAVLVEGTGSYSRPIQTESDLAQRFFDQGLRLMYGYYALEAVASHQEALRHDPDNAMIHWALALALGPNPNSRYGKLPDDPQGTAWQAIVRASALAGSVSDKEKALIAATRIRFDDGAIPDTSQRDLAYLSAMRSLHRDYPDDPDIGTLVVDAYMVTEPWHYWTADGEAKPGTILAAEALDAVMSRHPQHPGANHLYIHLIEASPEPERALPAADRLEGLMPIAGHIVHMPSHIYVRVGDYRRAIETNERSVEADKAFLKFWGDLPLPKTGTYFLSATNHTRHAVDFIRYASTVQGNYAAALKAARDALKMESAASIRHGRGQRSVIMPWLVHKIFGRWDALAEETHIHQGLPYVDGIWMYVQGSRYVAIGDFDRASDALSKLRELQSNPELKTIYSRFNPVATTLLIAALGLDGEIKQARGDLPGAIASFEQAVSLESELSYIEPPDWTQPMRHYLGAALLAAGRAEDAEQVYRQDLAWNRNNGWALYGLWRSLEAQGRTEEARTTRSRFQEAWRDADTELEASRF